MIKFGVQLSSKIIQNMFMPFLLKRAWKSNLVIELNNAEILTPLQVERLEKFESLNRFPTRTLLGFMPTPDEIASTLAVELKELDWIENDDITATQIRSVSEKICLNWRKTLTSHWSGSILFKDYFKEMIGDPSSADLCCKDFINEVFASPKELYRLYFKGFSDSNSIDKIRVYFPNYDIWNLDSSDEYIDVGANPFSGCNKGFFRIGCNYCIKESKEKFSWLRLAFSRKNVEYGLFSNGSGRIFKSDAIWAA
jgi:hypothetical protein